MAKSMKKPMKAGRKAMKAVMKAALKKKAVSAGTNPLALKRTIAGQNFMSSGLCLATKNGKACPRKILERGSPYCKECMAKGDPALKVVGHPLAGKILVAARDIPAGYRVSLWGKVLPKKVVEASKACEWAFEVNGKKMLDPTKNKGSLVQFCPCPGPGEIAAIGTIPGETVGKNFGFRSFQVLKTLKKNWQVTLQYGNNSKDSDEFFKDRGITRLDVGTKKNPALRRADKPLKK